MSLLIREARPSDAQKLAALSIQVWLHTYAKSGIRDVFARYVFDTFTRQNFEAGISDPAKRIFVAEISDHLAGYVQLHMEASCPVRKIVQPEVERLYVQEHFTGRGIGSALFDRVLDSCRSHECGQLWLLVNRENSRAYRFYESKLFQKAGTVDFELESERHANDVLVRTV